MPRFSIVIPTRDRARLLDHALSSALAQTYDDYEVVVSSNAGRDDTEQLLARLACDRLRVVRTDRLLPMNEHWTFALPHARGEHVLFLSDDDALHPGTLQVLAETLDRRPAELITFGSVTYVHAHWPDETERNTLTGGLYANGCRSIDARLALTNLFAMRFPVPYPLPTALCAVTSRAVIDRLTRQMGTLFLPTSPDYSFLAAALSAVDEYLWLDAPLLLRGMAPESIGINTVRNGSATQAFVKEMTSAGRFVETVPLQQATNLNSIADTILRTRNRLPALDEYELDWANYFVGCRWMLDRQEEHGVDTRAHRLEYATELGRRDPSFQRLVEQRYHARDEVPPPPTSAEREEPLLDLPAPLYVPPAGGDRAGFSDMTQCAAWLGRQLKSHAVDAEAVVTRIRNRALDQDPPIRRVVLYGMGRHGQFLWSRLSEPLRAEGIDLEYHDDRRPNGVPEPNRTNLHAPSESLEDTLVVVTPWEDSAITQRLPSANEMAGARCLTWRETVAHVLECTAAPGTHQATATMPPLGKK